jgi:hypothetical protein
MTDFNDILVKIQKQRKKYSEMIDAFHVDIEGNVEDIITCGTSDEMWNYRDKLEETRGVMYKLKKSAARNLAEIKDNYRDSERAFQAGIKNPQGHVEERKAKYESQHITEYKIQNNLDRMVEDLERFSWYLEGRLTWVKDRQFWLQHKERLGN